ncbi:unnamed protein product, partial [Rotaria magnacalcarata]
RETTTGAGPSKKKADKTEKSSGAKAADKS